jgi:protein aurora borealis
MELSYNEETPEKQAPKAHKTPSTTPKNSLARFLLLSNNQSFTPSPSAIGHRIVRNPFESQLHERLHLPVISSPSLFQTLSTPKREESRGVSQEFEWTIEELSSLKPVNLVPHETQFREELDPIREAQAQAAINSFFTEQKIGK